MARKFYRWVQYFFRILLCWLGGSLGIAQVRPISVSLTLDSLQKKPDIGYSFRREPIWLFHPGHKADWASPTFDDRSWIPARSAFNPPHPPPGWRGVGWFRLHIRVDSSLVGPIVALRVGHRSASQIYLNGQQIGQFGKIGASPATHIDVNPQDEPLAFRFERPGEHVLAVRLSTQRPYFSRSLWNQQGFTMQIGLNETLTRLVVSLARVDGLQLALAFATGLFALLHLILFAAYPTRLSNLYYSGWLMLSTVDSVCTYLDFSLHDPVWQDAVSRLDIVVNFALAAMTVAFMYSVYYDRQPRRIWLFGALAILLSAFLLLDRSVMPYYIFFGFLGGCMLEVGRVVFLALRRGQPGVWLIGLGVLLVAIVFFLGPANLVGLWQNDNLDSLYQQALFTSFGYLILPLCTSIYLALDVARTSRQLEGQLEQVRDLSARALAQEAEKLQLIARQNEQLEQTVRSRTEQLQQQADKLREMDEVKSRFFANLTHEFRTPLTLMLGPAEQVLAQTQEATTRQQVGLLQRNAQRLLRLINQLLELNKLEADQARLVLAPADLIGLVQATLGSFASLASQKQISLQLVSDWDQLLMALDRPKLESILYNLLANALKFTPAGGRVSVKLTGQLVEWGAEVELRISDSGIGIPVDQLPYLFDRFYQVDASNTRPQEGTGIGLALTKELVELHGGAMAITSQEGIGTIVTVLLPMCQLQPNGKTTPLSVQPVTGLPNFELAGWPDQPLALAGSIPPERAERGQYYPGERVTEVPFVLLIEDNDEVRTFIRSSLADQYRILEASNGQEGVQLAQQQIPDLVITDLMMPQMDGYQVCATLKQDERTSHIPVIMLTAKADLDSKLDGLETGADSYLAKPFNQRELRAQMSNLITLRRQLRERYSRDRVWQTHEISLPSMEQVFLDRVRTALEAHLADEQYSVDRLCEEIGLGRTQLHRKLKALINQTPGELLRVLRLERAHDLLRGNVGTVADVAYRVGYGNPANFATSFSRQFGYPPSEVRKKTDL